MKGLEMERCMSQKIKRILFDSGIAFTLGYAIVEYATFKIENCVAIVDHEGEINGIQHRVSSSPFGLTQRNGLVVKKVIELPKSLIHQTLKLQSCTRFFFPIIKVIVCLSHSIWQAFFQVIED
jgi:hypothetical protein